MIARHPHAMNQSIIIIIIAVKFVIESKASIDQMSDNSYLISIDQTEVVIHLHLHHLNLLDSRTTRGMITYDIILWTSGYSKANSSKPLDSLSRLASVLQYLLNHDCFMYSLISSTIATIQLMLMIYILAKSIRRTLKTWVILLRATW